MTPAPLDFRTVSQMAAKWNRPVATVRAWCNGGHIPGAYKAGPRVWLIPANATPPHLPQGGRAHKIKENAE